MIFSVRDMAPMVFAIYDKYINMGVIKTFDQAFEMFIINVQIGAARYPTDHDPDYAHLHDGYEKLSHEAKESFKTRFRSVMSGNANRILYRYYRVKDMESFNLTLAGILNGTVG